MFGEDGWAGMGRGWRRAEAPPRLLHTLSPLESRGVVLERPRVQRCGPVMSPYHRCGPVMSPYHQSLHPRVGRRDGRFGPRKQNVWSVSDL